MTTAIPHKLEGAPLDAMVAICEGYPVGPWAEDDKAIVVQVPSGGIRFIKGGAAIHWLRHGRWGPSQDDAQAGVIIDREKISTIWRPKLQLWWAGINLDPNIEDDEVLGATGPTRCIAAMRCWVAHKKGDEVELLEGVV